MILLFRQLGIDDSDIGDTAFLKGMLRDAAFLGDPVRGADKTPDWVPAFRYGVDGLILVSGECHQTVAEKLAEVERIFLVGSPCATIHEAIRIVGDVRPGCEKGHEQFVSP